MKCKLGSIAALGALLVIVVLGGCSDQPKNGPNPGGPDAASPGMAKVRLTLKGVK